ncbi:MAG: DUF4097 family beta strand repeat-containing protein [Bacteroidetes bacterium]|nr:DUF4097 family beta strand repeat-containing protein [Bacteroidota bacterium]MDA1126644.1 DUF4097 family beta strand repeat-containing protein [Bacteroidota bacterium]
MHLQPQKPDSIRTIKHIFSLVLGLFFVSSSHLAFAQSPVASQEFTVGDYAEVEVSTSGGRIEVIGKSTTKVTVNAIAYVNGRRSSNANLDNWSITIEEIQGKIVAKAEKESNIRFKWFSWNNVSIAFEIETPVNTELNARTSGGSVSIENLSGNQYARTSGGSMDANNIQGNVEMRTSGGAIRLENIEGQAEVATSGGSIRAKKVTQGLKARTSGGSLHLQEISGSLEARTSGGSIDVRLVNPIEYIEVSTSGGNVTVEVPENLGYDLELTGSRVRTELRNFTGSSSRDAIKGAMNGGGIPLKARTSGGSVSLKYYKAAS